MAQAYWTVHPSSSSVAANHGADLLLCRHQVVDGGVGLQPRLHGDEQLDTVHHVLSQLHLAQAKGHRITHAVHQRAVWE